ncbi:Senescence-specific cysteine protease SAG39 [Ananas comosus]|uniref:Senescence-specific cysteine protease SAG39 n=1 Tax=Ananas comosus TaxID=4615 RepID=A0A199W0J7_ANACO|nr:Senescence-specific cysteine protease SAG39 [Ananas comosus]
MASSTAATRFLLLFFLLWAASATTSAARTARNSTSAEESVRRMHEQWMAQHGRVYKDAAEKERRFRIFKANVEYIESANRAGNRSYTLGPNRFTDLTNEEFRALYLGFRPTPRPDAAAQSPFRYADSSTPDSMDWRSQGAVTPIKDQGNCGNARQR